MTGLVTIVDMSVFTGSEEQLSGLDISPFGLKCQEDNYIITDCPVLLELSFSLFFNPHILQLNLKDNFYPLIISIARQFFFALSSHSFACLKKDS